MRLLFDQNLSPRLVAMLADLHAGSTHVRNESLQMADDDVVWAYAIQQGFVIVSKDADFHQRHADVLAFEQDQAASLLALG